MFLISKKYFTLILICVINIREISSTDKGTYLGCFNEEPNLLTISKPIGSPDICIEECENLYYRYAAMLRNICSCTNTLTNELDQNTRCTIKCRDSPSQYCGGLNAQDYYNVSLQIAGPVQNIRQTNHTDTSITMAFVSPATKSLLKQFIVRAKVLHTYSMNPLPPSPQWIFQKDDTQIELVNLHPGTRYNITIICDSIGGEGGEASLIVETEIGIPDIDPEQPKVLSQNDTMLMIEIKPIYNNNGPISFYRIIVQFIETGLTQNIDENLLTNYHQSQIDGLSYYIAAELEFKNRPQRFTIGDGHTDNRGWSNPPLPPKSHVHISIGVVSIVGNITKIRYGVTTHDQHDVLIVVEDVEDTSNGLLITLITACIIFGLLLVASIIIYFYLRIRLNHHRLQRLPSDHHELSLQGPIIEVENNGYIPDDYLKGNFEDRLNDLLDRIEPSQKFARNTLILDMNRFIGSGNFGYVVLGNLQQKTRCQVHVVSDDMEPIDQTHFLKEFDQILRVTPHPNILNFIGVSQTADWLYLLFEDTPSTLKKRLVEARIPPNVDAQRFSSFSEEFILHILLKISMAFEYLTSHRFIHRRICSYNIRMTSDNVVKISAFGATPHDDHGKSIDIARWCAPEVLRFQHYTTKSDIWSFGCLMWECCCLGGTLYANTSSGDLVGRIKQGVRPEQAKFIYDDVYQMMLNCWVLDPSERTNFEDISMGLRQVLTSPKHALSFNRQDGVVLPYYLPLLENESS